MADDLFKTNIHYIHTCFFCERCVLFKTIHFMRAGFVLDMCLRQNRQVWSEELGAAVSLRHNPREDISQQSHKTCRSGISVHSPFSKKGSQHCFSRAPKVFLRSSLVEWVVLATCQPLFVIVYEIFSLSKYNSVDIEDISLFIGFFSSDIFGETWCWRHWQEVARGFSTRLQRLKFQHLGKSIALQEQDDRGPS